MLHIKDLTYRIGDRLLLDHATARITAGQKLGLIGQNGTGKSTLLGLITGASCPKADQSRSAPVPLLRWWAKKPPQARAH
ncbi:hypothetical protein JCM17846_06990 [Iodidimonas nitroreducens]|uniref:ABC transporter domain-containing protein n=1 Tax=Iodidimonas nitroreducens TaxID=1236968 RepID=A0A5A7N4W1_9PROT|nr:ATP-binding cassette domain-containing protein [Iodidimonas nitroreducens]GER03017.1 hypothetical protein JCM17846_06990 [Iodidimonas nitroreducens]